MSTSRPREYPHLVSQGARRNIRWPIEIVDGPIDDARTPHVFTKDGMLDDKGALTPHGRTVIDDAVAKMAARAATKIRYCVVWAPDDCTYYLPDGTCRSSRLPPHGDLETDPYALDPTPLELEDVAVIALPTGCDETHVCIARHGLYVEITPGEPILVADFTMPWPHSDDVTAQFRDAAGNWKLPLTLRGVEIETVSGDALYGPIQPRNGPERIALRDPWPQDVVDAVEQIAGVPLPTDVFKAVWLAVDESKVSSNQPWRDRVTQSARGGDPVPRPA